MNALGFANFNQIPKNIALGFKQRCTLQKTLVSTNHTTDEEIWFIWDNKLHKMYILNIGT